MNRKDKSSNSRKPTSKTPPQIANFFSKPQTSDDVPISSTSTTDGLASPNRKRKLLTTNVSNQPESDDSNSYAQKLRKNAEKISKIKKTEKVDTAISAFFRQDHTDGLSDFESPNKRVPVKTPPVIQKKNVSKKRKQPDIRKAIKNKNVMETEVFEKVLLHHSAATGVNSDDLQMALALSRSLQETHSSSGESSNNLADIICNAECSSKEDIIRNTIQQFGFKKRDNNDYDFADFFTVSTRNKKWISKFTALTRRKENIQKEKFKKKVKNILQICDSYGKVDGESNPVYYLTSSYLQSFFVPENRSFNVNAAIIETEIEEFYTKDLVPISTVRCGCMLKNWAEIPGRDISPQRSNDILKSSNDNETGKSSEISTENNFLQPLKDKHETVSTDDMEPVSETGESEISTENNFLQPLEDKQHVTVNTDDTEPVSGTEQSSNISAENNFLQSLEDKQHETVNTDDTETVSETGKSSEISTDTNFQQTFETKQCEIVNTVDIELHHIVSNTHVHTNSVFKERNVRELSPDMFAGCDSSANNSYNDEESLLNVSIDRSHSSYRNSNDKNTNCEFVRKYDVSFKDQSCLNSSTTDDSECKVSLTQNDIHTYERNANDASQAKIDEEFGRQIETTSHQISDIVVLSSEDSNQGDSKISQPSDGATQQKPCNIIFNPTQSDHSLNAIRMNVKQLSFTERLELYNSDPSLSISLEDNNICSQASQPIQDSVIISDDEINDSMARYVVEELLHGTMSDKALKAKLYVQSHDSVEKSQSLSIDLDDNNIFSQVSQPSQDSIIISDDEVNYSMTPNVLEDILHRSMSDKELKTKLNVQSHDTIELSDSEEDNVPSQLSDDEIFEERESFLSIDCCDNVSQKNFDHILDDENFNSNQSLNDENLVNLSVKEICQKEFVSGSSKASSKNFLRTTSDMTFERHNVRNTPTTTNDSYILSDDEYDEFDALVKDRRFLSKSHLKEDIVNEDVLIVSPPSTPPAHSNEFMVQSMDHIYEVRTGILVTPKPDYENMDSPTRLEHLQKYGLKSLTKRKAVICLEHIYNRLHPFIELDASDDMDSVLNQKKARLSGSAKTIADKNVTQPETHLSTQPLFNDDAGNVINNIVEEDFDRLQENVDLIFLPSAPRRKISWCLEPLHIAWHNLIKSNPALYDQILQYKPVDLTEIRLMFKSINLRYETNDIIAFFDRKCITFKTDNKRNKASKKNGI